MTTTPEQPSPSAPVPARVVARKLKVGMDTFLQLEEIGLFAPVLESVGEFRTRRKYNLAVCEEVFANHARLKKTIQLSPLRRKNNKGLQCSQ